MMKKYSIKWKKQQGAWLQFHRNEGVSGEEKFWKIHYIEYDTEYSTGQFYNKADAKAELVKFKEM